MARGIHVNHDGNNTSLGCAFRIDSGMWNWATQDFTICGWSAMKGASTGSAGRAQCPFEVTTTSSDIFNLSSINFFEWFCDHTHENPWDRLIANVSIGGFLDNFTPTPNVLINENWFYAFTYSQISNKFNWYYAKDGAGALTARPTYSPGTHFNPTAPNINVALIGWDGTPNAGSFAEYTNYKVWNRQLSPSELLAEMKNVSPVIRTNLYAYWPLLNHTDTSDQSGNGHTLTFQGTVTDGAMNPADIRDARLTHDISEQLRKIAPEVRVTSDVLGMLGQSMPSELRMSADVLEWLIVNAPPVVPELRTTADVIEYLFTRAGGGAGGPRLASKLKDSRLASFRGGFERMVQYHGP